jgi:beta-galactosidase
MTTTPDRVEWSEKEGNIILIMESHTCNTAQTTCFENRFEYSISGNGKMAVDHLVTPQGRMPEWLPRVGLQLVLDSTFNQLEWFGRGPFETYPDRKTGAKIGVWSGSVADQLVPYLIPQENGNKTDVRWTEFRNGQGRGIRISGKELFSFSALPVQSDNLSRALYPFQLKPFDGITVNLDYALSGVGCTAISVLPEYRVYPSERRFRFMIEPLK